MRSMSLHSILFVAKASSGQQWNNFLAKLGDLNKPEMKGAGAKIGEWIWLIDLTKSAHPLGLLIYAAYENQVDYDLLPFSEAPQWLPSRKAP